MSIFKKNDKKQFGLICLCTFQLYLFVISIFYANGYPIQEFLYCLPVIAGEMLIHYLIFWRPKDECGEFYLIFNGIFAIITLGIFFGVYFGVFNQTMQYHLKDAQDCKVIGRYNTQVQYLQATESYSALYINFTLDGEQYLGYGCLSSQSNSPSGDIIFEPTPYSFINYCTVFGQDGAIYLLNQVKLPSWMCLPFDTDFEQLINLNKCYVHFYNNESKGKQGPAYTNARNRAEINKLHSFALTTFSKVLVPYDQYMWFLMMTFCPIFPAISIIFFGLTVELSTLINKCSKFKSNATWW